MNRNKVMKRRVPKREFVKQLGQKISELDMSCNQTNPRLSRLAMLSTDDLQTIFYLTEDLMTNILSSATAEEKVALSLFEGLSIESSYAEAKDKVNNLTKKEEHVGARIIAKAKFTRPYNEKLSATLSDK